MGQIRYALIDGRILFVAEGLTPGRFMTFWENASGSRRRFVSPELQIRITPEDTQRDLDVYAAKYQLTPVSTTVE